eukprot:403331728
MINRDQDRFRLKPISGGHDEIITFEQIQNSQPSFVSKKEPQIEVEVLGSNKQNFLCLKSTRNKSNSYDEDETKKRKTQETSSSLNPQTRETIDNEESLQQQQIEQNNHKRQPTQKLSSYSVQSAHSNSQNNNDLSSHSQANSTNQRNNNIQSSRHSKNPSQSHSASNLLSQEKLTRESFETICKLGDGSYGKVYLVRRKNTLKQYALKVLDKMHIIKHDKVESVHRERDVLMIAKHPNLVHLECTFSDEDNLYFLMEYVENKSLSELLKVMKPLPLELVRFYAAEIVSGLEFLHQKGIAHRDLKPENIMIDSKYHLKITDFGDSKKFTLEELTQQFEESLKISASQIEFNDDQPKKLRGTFVGTPLYVSPEMLDSNQSGPYTDLWALGCIIYQLLTGEPPFKATYDFQVFQMIQERTLSFPKYLPMDAIDLIDKLMQLNPYTRLGAGYETNNGYDALKAHQFFKTINFQKLNQISPPIPVERFKSAFQQKQTQQKKRRDIFDSDEDEQLENQERQDNVAELLHTSNLNQTHNDNTKDHIQFKMLEVQDIEGQIKQEQEQYLVKSGIVFKKKGVISNLKRKLILTNQPRLYYLDNNNQYKGDIILTPQVRAIYRAADRFEINCQKSGKTIIYRVIGEEAGTWVSKINRVLDAHITN